MDKNTKKHIKKAVDDVRRKDYEVTEQEWIKTFVHRGRYGVLATTHNQQPYATPINYIYYESDHALYFHGARFGRTRANMALNPKVCFNIAEMGELVPGEKSSNFGVDYDSVTIFGTARLVTDTEKANAVLLALMDKYFPDHKPSEDYAPPQPDELKRTAVYAIDITTWTAKRQAHQEK